MVNAEATRKVAWLHKIEPRFFVGAFIPFVDLQSLLSLASVDRHFRQLLKREQVWNLLYARDQPHVLEGKGPHLVLAAMNDIGRLLQAPSLQSYQAAHKLLVALTGVLDELDNEFPITAQATHRFRSKVNSWSFKLLLPDANEMLRQLPDLVTRSQAPRNPSNPIMQHLNAHDS